MGRKGLYLPCTVLAIIALMWSSAWAATYTVGDKELNLLGYITQNASVALHGDDYNNERDVNSLLTNVFLEADYNFANNAKFYVSGMFTADWIYDVKSNDKSWNDKMFNKSRVHRNKLYMDNEYWQLLKEAHVTWQPGDFFFRFGKQIVVWGEMDGFRLMDQINPKDGRRGFADVEFESTIIPIWLALAEYRPKVTSSWLTDPAFQFVFNPNVTFIPNQILLTGNNAGGIWAPQAYAFGNFPFGKAHVGEQRFDIDSPDAFNSDGFGYAFRVKGNILGSAVSLNYYYGREATPATISGGLAKPPSLASDGILILNPVAKGFYPLFRFVGGTFSRDIPPLAAGALGGVAPTVRVESIYAFNNTFGVSNPVTGAGKFVKSDEFRFGIGVDWKVKIPALNKRSFFTISPQYYYRRIIDFPDVEEGTGIKDNYLLRTTHTATLLLSTNYLNSKLTPSFFWMRDITYKSDFFRLQLGYNYSHAWQYMVGACIFDGSLRNRQFDAFSQKDYLYFKIGYKWG